VPPASHSGCRSLVSILWLRRDITLKVGNFRCICDIGILKTGNRSVARSLSFPPAPQNLFLGKLIEVSAVMQHLTGNLFTDVVVTREVSLLGPLLGKK
jgi:hypothetical protein